MASMGSNDNCSSAGCIVGTACASIRTSTHPATFMATSRFSPVLALGVAVAAPPSPLTHRWIRNDFTYKRGILSGNESEYVNTVPEDTDKIIC